MAEIIGANTSDQNFNPGTHDQFADMVRSVGVKRTEAFLVLMGWHPSVVKGAIRRIMRRRGW